MMKTLENLITLSREQEKLKKKAESMDQNSTSFNEDAEKQSSLQRNLDKTMQQLNELSQKTFAVTPEMGKALGDAKREMQQSQQNLQNRNGSDGGKH